MRGACAGLCFFGSKTPHPFFQQPNTPGSGRRIEHLIEASELEWTFLRPGMLALNSRHFWGPEIRAGNFRALALFTVPTAPIDERDVAAVAVRALSEEGHGGMEYVLTGPEF